MIKIRQLALLLPIILSPIQGYSQVTLVNNSASGIMPSFVFQPVVGDSKSRYTCSDNKPLTHQGMSLSVPQRCFTHKGETAVLVKVIGSQPDEPYLPAECSEFSTPLKVNDEIEIIFHGTKPAEPNDSSTAPQRNAICTLKTQS